MHDVLGWAAENPGAPLKPWTFQRREPRAGDVVVRVTHCGLCASDLHLLRDGEPGLFPLVAGHEMVGEVTAVGSGVTDLEAGDRVAVGNIIDSCSACVPCLAGRENACEQNPTTTYASPDLVSGGITQGGHATEIVVRRRFTYALPEGLDPAGAAPLLCAGVTTYAPLRKFGAGPGTRVGVIGIGGLGHLGVKFAHAMGAQVTALTTSRAKAPDALALGADDFVVTRDPGELERQARRFDLLLDTTGFPLALSPYLKALALDGTYVLAGIPPQNLDVAPLDLLVGEKQLAGAGGAGVPVTAQMLAFAAEHGVHADVEVITPHYLNQAIDRLARGDVRFRFIVTPTV